MENPIKMDDLGVPPFWETPIYTFGELITQNQAVFSLTTVELYPESFPKGFFKNPGRKKVFEVPTVM